VLKSAFSDITESHGMVSIFVRAVFVQFRLGGGLDRKLFIAKTAFPDGVK